MKSLLGAFNQEKALVGAYSVIVKTDCETDGALHSTSSDTTLDTASNYPELVQLLRNSAQ